MYSEIKNDIIRNWQNGDAYIRMIVINAAVFVFLIAIRLLADSFLSGSLNNFLLTYLGFSTRPTDLAWHPWTLISHMFVHLEIMHLISNLLLLNFAGRLLFHRTSNSIFYRIYFLSGLAGALGLFLFDNTLVTSGLNWNYAIGIGCSACVMGCLVCATVLNPGERISLLFAGPIKLMYLTAFLLLIDFIYLYSGNTGGHIAHLAGSGFGWWYGQQMLQGKYPGNWVNKALGLLTIKSRSHLKVSHRRPLSDEDYNAQKLSKQAEIDHILDKISRAGYDSLSKKEKDILHHASKK